MPAVSGFPAPVSLTPPYAVRKADPGDCALLPAVERASAELFRGTGLIDVDRAGVQSLDAHQAAQAAGLLWVASADRRPVGFALAERRDDQLYLAELSVHPAHGRKGLGRALVAEVCRAAQERRLLPVTLSTFRTPPWNAPFYARLGFQELDQSAFRPWHRILRTVEGRSMNIKQRCIMVWEG